MFSPNNPLWEGDAVEWYFDTRRDKSFRDQQWGDGSVHCFFTPMKLTELNPRFCLRPGYLDAIPQTGVKVAAEHGAQWVITPELCIPGYLFMEQIGTDWILPQPDPWMDGFLGLVK